MLLCFKRNNGLRAIHILCIILVTTAFTFLYQIYVLTSNLEMEESVNIVRQRTMNDKSRHVNVQQLKLKMESLQLENIKLESQIQQLQSEMESKVADSDLHSILYHEQGYIIGNPLNINKCRNAILSISMHKSMMDKFPNILHGENSPWFISRESLFAHWIHSPSNMHIFPNLDSFLNKIRSKVQVPNEKGFNNNRTSTYFHIEKAASSSTSVHLKNQGFIQEFVHKNMKIESNCSFTFVRDPLTRFISGYYTVNRLFWDSENLNKEKWKQEYEQIQVLKQLFTFLNINGEPQRFRAFVNDLTVFQSLFVFGFRHLHHMMSQTAILSVADLTHIGNNIQWFANGSKLKSDETSIHINDNRFFIGRVEQYSEHWQKLTEVCEDVSEQKEVLRLMPSYGARLYLNDSYLAVMDLLNWTKGDVLPAYRALDEQTFSKIVHYYWQDYVCFEYEPTIPDFNDMGNSYLFARKK